MQGFGSDGEAEGNGINKIKNNLESEDFNFNCQNKDEAKNNNVYADAGVANLSTTLPIASGYQYRISCKHYAKKNILSVQTIANTSNIVTVGWRA